MPTCRPLFKEIRYMYSACIQYSFICCVLVYAGAEDSDLDDILADLCKLEEDTKALQLAAADVSSTSRYNMYTYTLHVHVHVQKCTLYSAL